VEEIPDELTPEQEVELKDRLAKVRAELETLLAQTEDDAKPVDLGTPIGRLSRMDAIQQQQMTQANRRQHQIRLGQVERALAAFSRGEYGFCGKCEEPIGFRRLSARPETPFCHSCQSAIETSS
jgi:DnaK suppressor protein